MARRPQSESQSDVSIRRTLFVAAFVAFWMLGISARLVHLQVTRHDNLVARARQQQQDAIETSPTRGPVLDREERELARTIDTTSVFIVSVHASSGLPPSAEREGDRPAPTQGGVSPSLEEPSTGHEVTIPAIANPALGGSEKAAVAPHRSRCSPIRTIASAVRRASSTTA